MGLKNSILFTLADEQPHKTAEICDEWSISESDLKQEIAELCGEGLMIHVISPGVLQWQQAFVPLNEQAIRQGLSTESNQIFQDFEIYFTLNSTNDCLRSSQRQHPAVCLAEKQSLGKGRLGRQWVSPVGQNIYMSIHWFFAQKPERFYLLSLMTAMAVARALRALGYQDIAIKWPNDIYLENKKLGGILLETYSDTNNGLAVITGIGLNIAMQENTAMNDQPWISLMEVDASAAERRNEYIAVLLEALLPVLEKFEQTENELHRQWQEYDVTMGKRVEVVSSKGNFIGEGAGIDAQGQFQLHTDQGLCCFHSGDVSLRLQ